MLTPEQRARVYHYYHAFGGGGWQQKVRIILGRELPHLFLAKQMEGFKYDPQIGSFKGWLLHTTQWWISDQLRKRRGSES
jgi:hypothetical protein